MSNIAGKPEPSYSVTKFPCRALKLDGFPADKVGMMNTIKLVDASAGAIGRGYTFSREYRNLYDSNGDVSKWDTIWWIEFHGTPIGRVTDEYSNGNGVSVTRAGSFGNETPCSSPEEGILALIEAFVSNPHPTVVCNVHGSIYTQNPRCDGLCSFSN